MCLIKYRLLYRLAYAVKIIVDIRIFKAYYHKTQTLKKIRPLFIIFDCILPVMLNTIEFDYQLCFRAIKVSNVFTYNSLPVES